MLEPEVTLLPDDKSGDYVFKVKLQDYTYKVKLSEGYYQKLTGGKVDAVKLIEESFNFLLERESPQSILKEFDLQLINKYFPEYESQIQSRF